jgi:signal transduction histidine kinase
MPLVESVLAPLRDPQLAAKLAAHATSPSPAWLWSTDGSRIIWANAVGAAIFGAADAGECQRRRFGAKDATATQIVRLAATLPTSGQPRLERLRGFGADFGRALTCVCSRTTLADGAPAVLILAGEPAGPPLPLRERVRRLFADRARTLAAFAREGTLLYATEPALTRFVGAATLSTLGVDTVAAPALVNGSASGATPYGPVSVERLGSDASTVLVLMFGPRAGEIPAEQIGAGAGALAPAAAMAPQIEAAPSPPPAAQDSTAESVPSHVEAPPSRALLTEVASAASSPSPVEAPPRPPSAAEVPTNASAPSHVEVAARPEAAQEAPAPSQLEKPPGPTSPDEAGTAAPAPTRVEAPARPPLSAADTPAAAVQAASNAGAPSSPAAVPEPVAAAATPPAVSADASTNGAQPAEATAGTTAPAPPSAQLPAAETPASERRHPLRFVWQMDADGRFAIGSDEFIELMGPRTTASFGRLWSEIAAELNLDPDHQVARAVATHETWSSITLSWPVDESRERLAVELSGLPVFDRNRNFRGYRGFGVLRDIARTNQLARARRERPMGFGAQPEAAGEGGEASASSASPASPNAPLAEVPPPAAPPADMPPTDAQSPNTHATTPLVVAAAPEPPSPSAIPAESESPSPSVVPVPPPAAAEIVPRPERAGTEATTAKVVPFRSGPPSDAKVPTLSPVERRAFRELAQELTARLRGNGSGEPEETSAPAAEDQDTPAEAAEAQSAPPSNNGSAPPAVAATTEPVAANTLASASLAAEVGHAPADAAPPRNGDAEAAQPQPSPPLTAVEPVLLDRLPVGVLLHQHDTLLYANRRFLEWSGYESLGKLAAAGGLGALFGAPGAGALTSGGVAQPLSLTTQSGEPVPVEGRLFTVPWSDGSALALVLTSGEKEQERRAIAAALNAAEGQIGELKARLQSLDKTEEELRAAKREAHKAATEKADFLAKVSHEIRTPLNAITGFAEVIMAERFGPIGNERYRDYLKDIHVAGTHLVSLLNDLVDLSKIATGQLDLTFAPVGLNELTQQCVGIMQPQASRARIIIRTSLTPGLPQVTADERSLRQIVLNLLANSVKFTGPGGQVIVSTGSTDNGEIVLRVRDTGVGMSAKDVEVALEPFRQTATSGSWGSGGTGLGLPLTRALAEANGAHFNLKSAPNAGTLVEIAFPRAAAQ